jgi:hypothetical protein
MEQCLLLAWGMMTLTHENSTIDEIQNLFDQLKRQNYITASEILRNMASSDEFEFLPSKALLALAESCETKNWNHLSEVFIRKEFGIYMVVFRFRWVVDPYSTFLFVSA